jgi:hypothetical protein
MKSLRRMWVNQPSTLQPEHEHHGKNVLVMEENGKLVEVYPGIVYVWFTSGPIESQKMFTLSLSEGWK